jgi:hypothetical protein
LTKENVEYYLDVAISTLHVFYRHRREQVSGYDLLEAQKLESIQKIKDFERMLKEEK